MATTPIIDGLRIIPPNATTTATPDTIIGGATPGEGIVVYDFDGGSITEYLDFQARMSSTYASGGITVVGRWSASSATTGNVRWGAALRRFNTGAGSELATSSHTYTFNEVTDAAPTTARATRDFSISFTNGADMDSVAAGEVFILRIARLASDTTNDTMSGDAELWADNVSIRE